MPKLVNTKVLFEATKKSWDEIQDLGVCWWPGPMGSETFYIASSYNIPASERKLVRKGDYVSKIDGAFSVIKNPDTEEV